MLIPIIIMIEVLKKQIKYLLASHRIASYLFLFNRIGCIVFLHVLGQWIVAAVSMMNYSIQHKHGNERTVRSIRKSEWSDKHFYWVKEEKKSINEKEIERKRDMSRKKSPSDGVTLFIGADFSYWQNWDKQWSMLRLCHFNRTKPKRTKHTPEPIRTRSQCTGN